MRVPLGSRHLPTARFGAGGRGFSTLPSLATRSLLMGILQQLSGFAMQNVVAAALKTAGVDTAEQVVNLFHDHTSDHSRRLDTALAQAGQRAWQVLELSLAGDGFWQRCSQV